MFIEISILIVCLFVILFIGYVICQLGTELMDEKGLAGLAVMILSVVLQPFVLGLVIYLYELILENFFNVISVREEVTGISVLGFLILAVLLMFGSFSPTHTTKSGKADKRYKDNPAVAASLGAYILFVLICTGSALYLLNSVFNINLIQF